MNFFEKLLTEATSAKWNIKDCVPVSLTKPPKPVKGDPRPTQPVQVIGNPPVEPGDEVDPGDGNEGSGEEVSSSEKGKTVGKKNPKTQIDKPGDTVSDIDDGKEWVDDHSKIESSDGTGKSIIEKVYKEVLPDYRTMKKDWQDQVGKEKGGLMSRMKEYIKEEFDFSSILARLGEFKRKISENIVKKSSYYAGAFNPVSARGEIIAKGNMKLNDQQLRSAMMIIALDTSGSITQTELKSALGYINNIAKQFEQKKYGIAGEVFLLQWDSEVHGPLTKWNYIKEIGTKKEMTKKEREQMIIKGGGGNDVGEVFKFLDKHFVKNIDGKDYFVFGDKMTGVTGKDEPENAIKTRHKLKSSDQDYKAPKWSDEDFKLPEGTIKIKEGGFTNVPFLLFYTDGQWSTYSVSKSKLYRNNPGNVLYIVTDKRGIVNISPKNYVIHDLNSESQEI